MKTTHVRPLISATTRRADSTTDGADKSKEPVIRLKLDNPPHWDWQLTTTADALPVIQLLDKDGRLLVETSGFVAQRARGSFRDGLRTYESFAESPKEATPEAAPPKVVTGNRNFEGFSNKYGSTFCGFRPRKSRSEATVSSVSSGPRNGRKRHSSNASELKSSSPSSASWKESAIKRYSAGDYLRHQILEDLSRRSDVARLPPNEVAQNRYKRMREYLRSQSDSIHGSVIASEESPRNSFKSHQNVAEVSANVERKEPTLAERTLNKEDIEKIRRFLQEKIQAKMRQEQFLSRNSSFPTEYNQQTHNNEMKSPVEESNEASYSNYIREDEKQGSLRDYRTRKIRSDANIRLDSEIIETKGKAESKQQKSIKKNSSGSEKKKVYRKTKSDLLISHRLAGSSFDSEKDCSLTNYPTRRIKSQDNFERSWREYKERKKLERSQKDTDHHSLMEEDFMAKPRWKDLQEAACTVTNCKICENKSSCVDPTKDSEPGSATSETKKENNDRPGTSLQENYLRIDRSKATESKTIVKERQDRNGSSSPDFGYNSISKRNRMINELGGSCANSNVKKSDTFKIVDGGGDDDDDDEADGNDNCGRVCYDYRNKTNEDIATDYFRRVYELLRLRREEAKRLAEGRIDEGREDTSSSNYLQEEAQIKKRRRRRKMEKLPEGEDVILGQVARREAWTPPNGSSAPSYRGPHQQQQQQQQQQQSRHQEGSSVAKRPRHPAPPVPVRCAADDSDDKENGRPARQRHGSSPSRSALEEKSLERDGRDAMGSNLSRHSGKGLNGRRAQSSGNLCDPKGLNVGKILAPCSKSSREKYKFCGSLPTHLDGKNSLEDEASENNNVITDTITGNLGGTLPHKKKPPGAHFSDETTNSLDLGNHRSDESLDGDPWKDRLEGADLAKCRHAESLRKSRSSDAGSTGSCHHQHHHHRQHQHEWRRNSSTLSRGRQHRSAELDVSGTMPRRRQDSTKRSAPSLGELGDGPTRASRISIDKIDDEFLLKMVHRPDCELMRHRQQNHQQEHQQHGLGHQPHPPGKCVDLKLHKLSAGGEPQDQGYASERSPEDEHPPSLPGQPFPSVTPESTFRVTLQKSSRGLGLSVSGGGTAGPVRVKRLFPQQPAALSNKLQSGDILLAANGVPLTGLTNYEALEVLRTTSSTVELVICRLPGESNGTPPGAPPPPPPTRRDNPGLTLKIPLEPLPPLEIEPCGEFDIEMTKVAGSLGFTLRRADSSALGHYVRALVREPALSDGRIQPGDKIVAVDGAPLSPMSHEEAVALLRKCGPRVRLRLYRDLAQTPVSALSPTEPEYPTLRPAKTCLRQEAVEMLYDLAVRKLSPGTSSSSSCPRQSSGTSCNSPRRLRRPGTRSTTAETDEGTAGGTLPRANNRNSHASTLSQETSDSDQCSIKTQITNSQPETPANDIIDPPPLYDVCDSSDSSVRPTHVHHHHHHHHHHNHHHHEHRANNHHHHQQQQQQPSRPSFLDLRAADRPRFQFSVESEDGEHAGPVIVDDAGDDSNIDYGVRAAAGDEGDASLPSEPASMPPLLGASATAFSYKNPAYQSANPACGQAQQQLLAEPSAAAKGKAAHSSEQDIPGKIMGADDPIGSKGLLKWKGVMFAPSDTDETDGRCIIHEDKNSTESATLTSLHEQVHEWFMVELTRGWNSRLGFSLQTEGENTVISVVHPDSVAAKDGRLKQGDILIMVNDESVVHMSTADIIDLLRKIRGSIGITVLRRKKEDAT